MKTRILFVDDDTLVLQGLQRMLREMRNSWEMEFVESGRQALDRMTATPFDVVVADMRMPGMNGAELLNEVMKRFPQTIRLVLSGHADQELIIKCVGATHQFLSKPCSAEALKATLRRAASVHNSLENGQLKGLVSRMDRLPSIPALYVKVVEKLQDPEVSMDDIGALVAQDIGMTAKMLKLVNSAFFGLGKELSDAREAVAYLGFNTVKTLVLCIHAFSQFEKLYLGGLSLEMLWKHSLTVAGTAQRIAELEDAGPVVREEAFVAGMLHDAGRMVLAANFPSAYSQILMGPDSGPEGLSARETQAFGADHADVGGYLLGLWGLPVPVVESIAWHHTPSRAVVKSFGTLSAVHTAEALASPLPAQAFDEAWLAEPGMRERVEGWRKALQNTSNPNKRI